MGDAVVTLNVGGIVHTTTRSTLSKFPDSMLGALMSGKFPVTQDENGHIFIDRDGAIFRHILNFLRSTRLALPSDFTDYDLLLVEADFYQINPLIDAILHAQTPPQNTERVLSNYLEIIEMRMGLSATMPTNNSRVKTVLYGRKAVVLMLPEHLIGDEAMEKLREKNGNDFAEVEANGCNVRLRFCEVLKNQGWELIDSDLSSSSGSTGQGTLHFEQSYRDRWRLDLPDMSEVKVVENGPSRGCNVES